ncbi:MAG: hypothetical protein NT022_06720, partial [Deltaproteobacteria bacterium]|nr:hypothetical protein [Deltaproteobacteria bacterium]
AMREVKTPFEAGGTALNTTDETISIVRKLYKIIFNVRKKDVMYISSSDTVMIYSCVYGAIVYIGKRHYCNKVIVFSDTVSS